MNDFLRQHRKKLMQSIAPFVGSETGLLHLSSHLEQDTKSDGIPTALNLTYLLFLLRTKDRIYMEKALLELKHLLFFQSTHSVYVGNFPSYLHQFPYCERQFEVLECLYPIYWILIEFQNVLDAPLVDQIHQVVHLALDSLIERVKNQSYSFRLSLQLAMLYDVFGKYYQNIEWTHLAESLLAKLKTFEGESQLGSPRELSRLLLACSLMNESQMEQFSYLISHFDAYWHREFSAYIGPAYQEFFLRENPEETLYHLFMRYKMDQQFPFNTSLINLLNAELFLNATLLNFSQPNKINPSSFWGCTLAGNHYQVSWINWNKESWIKTGGVYPFKLIFHDRHKCLHSFVMQMGTYVTIKAQSETEFLFEFDPCEEELEIEFFWDLAAKGAVSVEGEPTSMFEGFQPCHIQYDLFSITLQVFEGNEDLWGQLMQKDRKSQLMSNLSEAYDKHLYYRTTKPSASKIKIKLTINN